MSCDARPKRCWINQPSTHQPVHCYHGVRVLSVPYSRLVYFLEGETVSAVVPRLALSDGWPPTSRRDPQ